MKLKINSMQLEIINYNSIDQNINFLQKLSEKFDFYNPISWEIINFSDFKKIVTDHLNHQPTMDVFLSKKN